jgi:glycerophosphoryl diester phosphodiesterase
VKAPLTLLRGEGPLLRIGHRGAAALAPANTMASIETALRARMDMVELDVIARSDGSLVLGHSPRELGPDPPPLDRALGLIAADEGTLLLADVKRPGYESALVDALRRHDLVERTLVSSAELGTLKALRRIEPSLMRGWTYPRDRLRLGRHRPLLPVGSATLAALRAALPLRIGRLLAETEASVATLQHRIISRAAVERCHSRGVAVFAWTVNDPAALVRLKGLGVDGVITDDPRVFRDAGATLQA